MSKHDITAMFLTIAVTARDDGHPQIQVRNGRVAGQPAIIIVLPGYTADNGRLIPAEPITQEN